MYHACMFAYRCLQLGYNICSCMPHVDISESFFHQIVCVFLLVGRNGYTYPVLLEGYEYYTCAVLYQKLAELEKHSKCCSCQN